jgi:hypothetical protein
VDRASGPATDSDARHAIGRLPLDQLEETSGELHRRIGAALRRIGEGLADREAGDERAPRRRVAELAALIELAGATFASTAAGGDAPPIRTDRHPASAAALMYAAPTIDGLLQRLEQDRRLLTSFARQMESRIDYEHATAWGHVALRTVLAEAAILEPARCAQALERRVAEIEEAEIRRLAEVQAKHAAPDDHGNI